MHAHRLVPPVGHRAERVAAARRGDPAVHFGYVDAVDARYARAVLHLKQLQRGGTVSQSPMSTRESLSAQLMYPLLSVCTRCVSRQSLPLQLSAKSQLPLNCWSGPSSPEHKSSVSESLMWHTLNTYGDLSCRMPLICNIICTLQTNL